MIQKKIIAMLGVWLPISTILLQSPTANTNNLIIVGVISAISGLTLTVRKSFIGWAAAVLGFWLIVSAFIPLLETIPCKFCNSLLTAVIFIVIGFTRYTGKTNLINHYN